MLVCVWASLLGDYDFFYNCMYSKLTTFSFPEHFNLLFKVEVQLYDRMFQQNFWHI